MPKTLTIFFVSLVILTLAAVGSAQEVPMNGNLVYVIPGVYGPGGLTLPNTFHQAHFNSSYQESFTPLNSQIGIELSRLPFASPASGFAYTFDKSLGVWSQVTLSFGPVFSERAETIGRHKLVLGFGFQHAGFDSLDGIDLHNIPVVFRHQETAAAPTYEEDYITTTDNVDLSIDQYTLYGTFGLTNRLDLSVAIPFEHTKLNVTSDAHIVRIAPPTMFGESHYFDANDPVNSVNKSFASGNSASGIGDVILRGKGTVWRGEKAGLALGFDLRLPTGDEYNLLGSGTFGAKPFVAFSYRARIAPHANLGYEWNGDSILAGDVVAGVKSHLPNQLLYSVGVDVGVAKHVSADFEIVGQRIFDTDSAQLITYTGADSSTAPSIAFFKKDVGITSASIGGKVNIWRNLLLNGNVLIKLDDGGLRSKVIPYGGISYTF